MKEVGNSGGVVLMMGKEGNVIDYRYVKCLVWKLLCIRIIEGEIHRSL